MVHIACAENAAHAAARGRAIRAAMSAVLLALPLGLLGIGDWMMVTGVVIVMIAIHVCLNRRWWHYQVQEARRWWRRWRWR
jgi:hypothetical protein